MKQKKIKVSITGNIGSGKSTFTSYLVELGYPVINADEISKLILRSDSNIRKKIISKFGEQSFSGSDINTLFIASKVFSDKKNLKIINSILHPPVIVMIQQKMDELLRNNDIIFCETALLFEAKLTKLFNYTVLIVADYEIRKGRLIKSSRITSEQFSVRDESQGKVELKIPRSDFVFYNNGPKNELRSKTELLLYSLNSLISKNQLKK